MAMTWNDIKVATLQKMYAAQGSSIPTDGSADDYVAGMPYVANEALNMLATAGRYLLKSYVIAHDGTDKKYDLPTLISDFYMLDHINFETTSSVQEFYDYKTENNTLYLYGCPAGNYVVYYKAYPTQITMATLDTYVFPLPNEVVVLLPLYMASQLYKEDDPSIATTLRNEFEVAFERLERYASYGKQEFTSESGWI